MDNSDMDLFESVKTCPDCGVTKPFAGFRRNKARPDGLSFYCKECFSARDKAGYRNRQEKKGRTVRERVETADGFKWCPDCETAKPHSEWSRNRASWDGLASYCKACFSKRGAREYLKRTYKMTPEEAQGLVAWQGGVCRICQAAPAVHIDHDHDDGTVRGVLCFKCNAGIGQFADSSERLRRAAAYLEAVLAPPRKWTQPDPEVPVYLVMADGDVSVELAADYAHA
jgi:hypothetical protein